MYSLNGLVHYDLLKLRENIPALTMPFTLAKSILEVLVLYFIDKDFFWRNGSKANKQTGRQAQRKVNEILSANDTANKKEQRLEELEAKSKEYGRNLDVKVKSMFKTNQAKYVLSFFKTMYQSEEDGQQQLYYFLSISFITKKHFLKLARDWKDTDENNVARYLRNAYFHAKKCGPLGVCSAKDLRSQKKFKVNGKVLRVEEIVEHYGIERLDFVNMSADDFLIPFTAFDETKGLRFCTEQIKEDIETKFGGKPWFTLHQMLDLTPTTLFFVCLIAEEIPEVEFAFANAPFEARVAKQIYPRLWESWRSNKIKELVFMGMNNWFSDQCHAKKPVWVQNAWKAMEPLMEFIEVKYVRGNFVNGQTKDLIKGQGYCCFVVHCKKHPDV